MKKSLSVAIATYNEEINIRECLESVKWAEEIVVFDESSTDQTVAIAKKYTDRIFVVKHDPMFHKTKQQAMDKCTGDWILQLDADERIAPRLAEEIKKVISRPEGMMAFRMPRRNFIFGRWMEHSGWYPDHQVKLFQRGKGHYPCQTVHEVIKVEGEIGSLQSELIHHHYTSVFQFIERLNRYTANDAKYLLAKGEKIDWTDAIKFPVDEFIKRFFFWEGYKDGVHGLVLALLQAFSRLVVFAKIWEEEGFWSKDISLPELDKVVAGKAKDYKYWVLTEEIKLTKNPLKIFTNRLRRKLQ